MNGIQEVSGSIPLISTKTISLENIVFSRLFFFACGAKSKAILGLRPRQPYPHCDMCFSKRIVFRLIFAKCGPTFLRFSSPFLSSHSAVEDFLPLVRSVLPHPRDGFIVRQVTDDTEHISISGKLAVLLAAVAGPQPPSSYEQTMVGWAAYGHSLLQFQRINSKKSTRDAAI